MKALLALPAVLALSAPVAAAATFNVVETDTSTLLGMFEAPKGGGAVSKAVFTVEGGMFDSPGIGGTAPVYDAANNWITGASSGDALVYNTIAFETTDVDSNPVSCDFMHCAFRIRGGGAGTPAEWFLDYPASDGEAAWLGSGYYEIVPTPTSVPLPATALVLAGALAALAGLRRLARWS